MNEYHKERNRLAQIEADKMMQNPLSLEEKKAQIARLRLQIRNMYECKKCINKVVMHAFSEGKCEKCGDKVVTSHIPCDKLCLACAEEFKLCKSCGEERKE